MSVEALDSMGDPFIKHPDIVEVVRRTWHLPPLGTLVTLYPKLPDRAMPRTGTLVDLVVTRGQYLEALALTLADGRSFTVRWASLAGVAVTAPASTAPHPTPRDPRPEAPR